MKTIIVFLISCFLPLFAVAENCSTSVSEESAEETREITTDVPNYLKGATITVRTADGKESTVPAEKFKVVPRKQQYLVTKTKQQSTTMCSAEQNRLSLLAGKGPKNGLHKARSGDTVSVENNYGAVGGVQYQYKFDDSNWSVGGQLQTNTTGLLNLGYDF